MAYHIEVIVRGSQADHTITGPTSNDRAEVDADLEKIREAMRRSSAEKHDEAREALPSWLIVDAELIVSASISGAAPGKAASF